MRYPLTHPQKRIWYIQKIHPHSPLHNIGGCLQINGEVHLHYLKKSIQSVIKTNEALRLRFSEDLGEAYQYVNEYRDEEIDFIDFSECADPIKEKEKWIHATFQHVFTLENSKLYYFGIYKVSDKEYGLLLNIHHIISDGWSISLIQKQICERYSCFLRDEENEDFHAYSYIDYIDKEQAYFSSERFNKNRRFWNEKFSELPESCLYKSFSDLEAGRKTFQVDADLTKKIRNFLDIHKISLNTFYMTVMMIYLNKTLDQEDIVLGTPILNRTDKKDKNTIGMYTSTMPFRMKVNASDRVSKFLTDISTELRQCLVNQRYPYDLLISDLELNKKGFDSLFKIGINYYNTQFLQDIGGIPASVLEYNSGQQNYSLQLVVNEWSHDHISLNFDYKKKEYTDENIDYMYQHITNIIVQLVNELDLDIKDIHLFNEDEFQQKVFISNETKQAYPDQLGIHELFELQVQRSPEEVVLMQDEKKMTYQELNKKSNQLAHFLIQQGIGKGKIVAIKATHSFELVIAILGVLKSGGAYLPIEPSYPVSRINYMLSDSQACALLTNEEIDQDLDFAGGLFDLRDQHVYSANMENIDGNVGSSHLAYIIYTSGSTGQPKGVMIEHRNLVNYIWWASKQYDKGKEVFALYSSISFDLTVTSIFTPLITGSRIQIYYDDHSNFILEKILRDNVVTVLKLTPAHLTLLKDLEHQNQSIKRMIVGGDNLKVSTTKSVLETFRHHVEVYNEYGPTETTVGCMIYQYNPDCDRGISVPIGLPIDNTQIYILDKYLKPVATGIHGEIYVSGAGVGRGYLNREIMTQERFIPNPYLVDHKIYKTGDIATYLPDGNIEYIGRSDHQVKIRGFRIELGEIEKYLIDHPWIQNAHVMIRENEQGDKILYAYYVSDMERDSSELKIWLKDRIPRYMIPNFFIWLKVLPLTVNGKVNTNELPIEANRPKQIIHYRNEREKILVLVMKDVLGAEEISMSDSYFHIGGDSIKAIQIVSKLKSKQYELQVKDILEKEYIEDIAMTMKEIGQALVIDQSPVEGKIRNSPILEWFFSNHFQDSHHFNQSILLECKKPFKKEELQVAVNKMVEHHDILRINVNTKDQNLYYRGEYLNPGSSIVLEYDLSSLSTEEQYIKMNEIGYNVKSNFDLENQILFKVCSFIFGENKQFLLFTAHHIVVDGVSWRILIEDFITIMEQLDRGEEIELPLKTHSYQQWVQQLATYAGEIPEKEIAYWEEINHRDFNYPVDRSEGEVHFGDSHVVRGELHDEALQQFTHQLYEIYGLELHEGLIIALLFTIYQITQLDQIVIELEGHGREFVHEEIDVSRTVGWFTSMYPASFSLVDQPIDYNIKMAKEQLRNIPNKGFHYGILKYLLGKWKDTGQTGIRFNYLGDLDNTIQSDNLQLSNRETGTDIGYQNHLTALLDINAMVVANQLQVSIRYSRNRFKEETVQKFLETYFEKINEIVRDCLDKGEKVFTPSDFHAEEDISLEDLESLFE